MSSDQRLLAVEGMDTGYAGVPVVRGLDLHLDEGEVVALLGPNGAGKTTTLLTISGLIPLLRGSITVLGEPVDSRNPHRLARLGLAHVAEDRSLFFNLTVQENLKLGLRSSHREQEAGLERALELFPALLPLMGRRSGLLSGGEQQMLALGRALIAQPDLIMLDEPSLGLAPLLVEEIFTIVARINREQGTAILLVEQNAAVSLAIASYGYIMENGKIVIDGPGDKLTANEDVQEFYLGVGGKEGEARSYRDIKHYKRRKRWLS